MRHPPRPRQQRGPRRPQIQPRPAQQVGRIDLQGHQLLQPLERMAEHVPHPLHRAEQVAEHGEAAAGDVIEEQGRPARAKHPPLNLRRLQSGVDRLVDADQLPGGFQIVDALAEVAVHERGVRGQGSGVRGGIAGANSPRCVARSSGFEDSGSGLGTRDGTRVSGRCSVASGQWSVHPLSSLPTFPFPPFRLSPLHLVSPSRSAPLPSSPLVSPLLCSIRFRRWASLVAGIRTILVVFRPVCLFLVMVALGVRD